VTQLPSLDDVLYVYRSGPGGEDLRPAGKVLAHGGHLQVLADYHGLLSELEGDLAEDRRFRAWRSVLRSPYFQVVSARELRDGERPDLLRQVPVADAPEYPEYPESEEPAAPAKPPSRFLYHHPALREPLALEVGGGRVRLGGADLSDEEASAIRGNLRSGAAMIRYDPTAATEVAPMAKMEPKLAGALGSVRDAVRAGHLDPAVLRQLTHEIFVDPMVPGVGNKKAYEDFLSRPRDGVHVRLDANDFGQINKVHSFEHGNEAIRALGHHIREAARETVGTKHAKVYRIGGDEFHVHVPGHEHAANFMRALRGRLERHPPAGGTHDLSVSAGFALTPEGADQASLQAKAAKKAAGYAPGRAKTHVYSAVPGHEGHVPMSPEQLPVHAPPPAQQPPVPALSASPSPAVPAAGAPAVR
jgi:GGDEF domain-containing protein